MNNQKKLQIFISSTYSDLIEERQACVEAVLRAGHIPAGMELFSAGSETQLEIIKRWIDDSDVYMLLLGGRYGTIEPKSNFSYTEFEYRYAIEIGKPIFSLIVTKEYLDEKVKLKGADVLEILNAQKYNDFKKLVLERISRFFSNVNEIKLGIFESLLDIQNRYNLKGWIKSDELPNLTELLNQIQAANEKIKQLEEDNKILESSRIDKIGDFTYQEIYEGLSSVRVELPGQFIQQEKNLETTVLDLFYTFRTKLSIGINNSKMSSTELDMFLIHNVISHLRIYDLAEIVKVAGVQWSKFQTSKLGNKFIAIYQAKKDTKNSDNTKLANKQKVSK